MPDIFQDSSRYFHISAFYALSLPYYHMEHHTHSSYEIMYITSGSCRVSGLCPGVTPKRSRDDTDGSGARSA